MIIQDVADFGRLAVLTYCAGYANDQFGARSGDDDMLSTRSLFSRSCSGFRAAC